MSVTVSPTRVTGTIFLCIGQDIVCNVLQAKSVQ